MTIFYPDVSEFQAGARLRSAVAVCARASEGDWLTDSAFTSFKNQAATLGAFFFSYHFLESSSSASSQAALCYSIVKNTPLMLDFEPINGLGNPRGARLGSSHRLRPRIWPAAHRFIGKLIGGSFPSVAQAVAFVDAFRGLGGTCNALYLPKWYWQQLGSPSLAPFIDRKMVLVSSSYTLYTDSGPGWQPYGGMAPSIWQYTDNFNLNGTTCDFNAFKGTLDELKCVISGQPKPPPPPPLVRTVASGDDMFTIAPGANTTIALTAPKYVLGAAGPVAPSTVELSTNAPVSIQVNFGNAGEWSALPLDFAASPVSIELKGRRVLKIRRLDAGSNAITGVWS